MLYTKRALESQNGPAAHVRLGRASHVCLSLACTGRGMFFRMGRLSDSFRMRLAEMLPAMAPFSAVWRTGRHGYVARPGLPAQDRDGVRGVYCEMRCSGIRRARERALCGYSPLVTSAIAMPS